MKCPICKLPTGFYKQEDVEPGTFVKLPYPLYQRSYPGKPKYISPRCERCYDKAVKTLDQEKGGNLSANL